MRFTKMHGSGNDYVVIDGRSTNRNWGKVAAAICSRHFSVGSDGLLVILPASDSKKSDIRMQMFNPDGSEAEMCGNGIRCFVKFVIEQWIVMIGGASQRDYLRVETKTGIKTVKPLYKNGKVVGANVNMGTPAYKPKDIPVKPTANGSNKSISLDNHVKDYILDINDGQFAITCVSMGNPHAVSFIDEPVREIDLGRIGPLVENHEIFPNRTNFEIVNLSNTGELTARVWERGVGETLSCGTGVCAIAAAADLKGLAEKKVNITMPGGKFKVEWDESGDIWMTGPAEETFTGEWEDKAGALRKKNR